MQKNILYRTLQKLVVLTVVIAMTMSFVCTAQADTETDTEQEREVIRVGFFPLAGFHEYDRFGAPTGYDVDYLEKIAEYTDWEYDYVNIESWPVALEKLRNKEIDILAPSQATEERKREFEFTSHSIGTEYGALLALEKRQDLIYEDFNKFSKLKIGCVETLVFRENFFKYAGENGFTPQVEFYKDTNEVMEALRTGEVDAIVANIMVLEDDMKILAKFGSAPFYYMAHKDSYSLIHQVNYALDFIKSNDPQFEGELVKKYYERHTQRPFTKKELDFISKAPVISVGCLQNRDPVSYLDTRDGQIKGITKDVLEKISQISGLKFQYVALPEGQVTYDTLREKNVALISCVEYNRMNLFSAGMKLSTPYLKSQKVFVTRRGEAFLKDANLKLAVATGSQTLIPVINSYYPNLDIIVYDNIEQCMDAVKSKEADAMMQNQYTVNKYLSKPKYADLSIVPNEGMTDELCLSAVIFGEAAGVQSSAMDYDTLISIIDKSIYSISEDEMAKMIIGQTTARPYELTIDDFLYKYKEAIFFMVIALAVFIWAALYTIKTRQRSMEKIKQNEIKLKNITNNINGGVIVLLPGKGFKITYANEGFFDLINEEYHNLNNDYITYVHPDDLDLFNKICHEKQEQDHVSMELRIRQKHGAYVYTLFNGTLAINENGEKELYCVIMDITDQKRMLEKLTFEQERYALLMEKSEAIIFEYDMTTGNISISRHFKEKFGWSFPKKFQVNNNDIYRIWRVHTKDTNTFRNMTEEAFNGIGDGQCLVRLEKSDGSAIWCEIAFHRIRKQGENSRIVGTVVDIDKKTREELLLIKKSKTDALTGLLNKESFKQEVTSYLENDPSPEGALAFIDLDNFKKINDVLGHLTGDRVIEETARKLQVIFSSVDIISRFGGDEFCVLIKSIPRDILEDKLRYTLDKLRERYENDENGVEVSASIGISLFSGTGQSLENILECADKALYRAKEEGRNKYMIYDENQCVSTMDAFE